MNTNSFKLALIQWHQIKLWVGRDIWPGSNLISVLFTRSWNKTYNITYSMLWQILLKYIRCLRGLTVKSLDMYISILLEIWKWLNCFDIKLLVVELRNFCVLVTIHSFWSRVLALIPCLQNQKYYSECINHSTN